MTVLIGFYVSTMLVKIWQCNPRERIWNKSVPGHCIEVPILYITSGLFNTLTDVIILLVPVKLVWNLQTRTKKKVGVVAVFTVGFWWERIFPCYGKICHETVPADCFLVLLYSA